MANGNVLFDAVVAAVVLVAVAGGAEAQFTGPLPCPIDPSQCDPCFFDPSLCPPTAPPVPASELIGLNPTNVQPTRIVSVQTVPFSTTLQGTAGFPSLSGLDFQPGTGTLFASSGIRDGGRLFTVTPSTGTANLVGPTPGFSSVSGIAFDLDGTLYGSAGTNNNLTSRLIEINPNTGAGQFIGLFGSVGGNTVRGVDALAVHPSTGTLYASSGAAFDGTPGDIFIIDKSNGQATRLGAIREYGSNSIVQQGIAGLAFDSAGNLFGSLGFQDGRLIHIDLDNFMFQYVGDTGSRSLSDIAVMPPPPTLPGDANNDLIVSGLDLIAVQEGFGNSEPGEPTGLLRGDANDDGVVSGLDLIKVQENFGKAAPPSAIPEPAAVVLLAALGGVIAAGRRR